MTPIEDRDNRAGEPETEGPDPCTPARPSAPSGDNGVDEEQQVETEDMAEAEFEALRDRVPMLLLADIDDPPGLLPFEIPVFQRQLAIFSQRIGPRDMDEWAHVVECARHATRQASAQRAEAALVKAAARRIMVADLEPQIAAEPRFRDAPQQAREHAETIAYCWADGDQDCLEEVWRYLPGGVTEDEIWAKAFEFVRQPKGLLARMAGQAEATIRRICRDVLWRRDLMRRAQKDGFEPQPTGEAAGTTPQDLSVAELAEASRGG